MPMRRRVFGVLLAASLLGNVLLVLRLWCGMWPWTWASVSWYRANWVDSQEGDTPFAYRMYLESLEPISPCDDGGTDLPDELVIAPGVYRLWGRSYDLQREGAYRFVRPHFGNVQRIVYHRDLDALLSGLAWIASHGSADDALSIGEKTRKARRGKLSVTCGPFSELALDVLLRHGADARLASAITLDEWNTYDNGHVLLEVFRKEWGKYVVYDLDNNAYFVGRKDLTPLSLVEFARAVQTGDYGIGCLANDTRVDVSGFGREEGFDWAFLGEKIQADLRRWYGRVIQVVLLSDGKERYFFDQENARRISSYSPRFRYLDRDAFMEKFYPKVPSGSGEN